ncbi:MAG: tetratricopeptide repeat protein [bacterium]|nr:tetratricopeptide repeat protein [bacterium]
MNRPLRLILFFCLFFSFPAWSETSNSPSSATSASSLTPSSVIEYCLNQIDQAQGFASPDFKSALEYIRGMTLYRAFRYEEAIEAFKKALLETETAPANGPVYSMLGACRFKQSRFEDALKWYRKEIETNPKSQGTYARIGACLEKLNRNEEALKSYLKCIENEPHNPSAHYYAAKLYFDLGKMDEARQYAERCHELDERFSEPHYLLAQIARKQGDMDKARAYLDEFKNTKKREFAILDESPQPTDDESSQRLAAQTLADIAGAFDANHDAEHAILFLKKADAINPGNDEILNTLGSLLIRNQQYDEAAGVLKRRIALKPHSADLHYELAGVYARMNRLEEAEPHYRQAALLAPDNAQYLAAHAEALLRLKRDLPLAINLLEDAVSIHPNPEAFDLLSKAYFFSRQLEKSIDAMRRAIELAPNNMDYQKKYQKLISLRNR